MEEGLTATLVQVGIRAMTGHQREQADRFGVEVIDMRRWVRGDRPSVPWPVYVSIDIDGIDPAFAPGVSHPEHGGLSVRDLITILHDLPGPILGGDIVEFNPRRDPQRLTAGVAAKLVKELAACIMLRGRR
jgi:arginase family enzyme